jgi:DNA (cytosine-5)-methyltransferase 1
MRPRMLDVCAGEGGAGVGYDRAGFEVLGVDLDARALRRYPFRSVLMDAFEAIRALGPLVEAVHASFPCQSHSDLQKQSKIEYPDLIEEGRGLLEEIGKPYVIENVEGAPLRDPVRICGAGIPGLRVIRHRLFESNIPLVGVPCPERHPLVFTHDKRKAHYGRLDQDSSFVQVTGGGNCTVANKRAAMGTPWMTGRGCNEAIPPAYAEHVGLQLMEAIR